MGRHVLTLDEVAAWSGPPLILFVGIDTGGSGVHAVFDRWAAVLGQPWTLRGVDLPPDTPEATYRRLVQVMRDNPAVRGAVVTAHKLRLYRACAADVGGADPLVDLTHEVNALATADGGVTGYARDPVALGHVLPALLPPARAGGHAGLNVLCLGAGGAATALLLTLHLGATDRDGARLDAPAHVTFTDTRPEALTELRRVADRARIDASRVSYVTVGSAWESDALLAGLPTPALVVNATGLGKDSPGSPLTEKAPLGPAQVAWDLNYRGDLTFLRQAAEAGAHAVDGWDYFVAGWAAALTAIAGIPLTGDLLTRLADAAARDRPAR
ncbi:shikimate dehydrogenase [Micromonospora sp. 15K316]|uniref:shikimate dehydrogenase n=1 Tax=Micromonospora sp. 15K316 TaxID=2530376 RepID=UPI00104D33BD|nr:shikimate dehydrogenase [Micromonospora sp. 15K316]TDC40104.1 shikimate dehydrogenase [Micromonospora sp. 15K316]